MRSTTKTLVITMLCTLPLMVAAADISQLRDSFAAERAAATTAADNAVLYSTTQAEASATTIGDAVVPLASRIDSTGGTTDYAELISTAQIDTATVVATADAPGGTLCGAWTKYADTLRISCQGHNPLYSCPTGYSQVITAVAAGGCCGYYTYSCAKT
jgi:hypothetical protein